MSLFNDQNRDAMMMEMQRLSDLMSVDDYFMRGDEDDSDSLRGTIHHLKKMRIFARVSQKGLDYRRASLDLLAALQLD